MYVGYWKSEIGDNFPVAIPNTASDEEISKMLKEIDNFKEKSISMHTKGISRCKLCGEPNGSIDFIFVRRGKAIHLPEGLNHYIEKHRVLVPAVLNLKTIMASIK